MLDWHADRTDLPTLALLDRAPESEGIDLAAVRQYRLGQVRLEMKKQDIPVVVLQDAVNIRYATGTRNMQVFTSRNAPSRYLLLTQEHSILYEFTGCFHLAAGFDTVTDVRPAITASYVASGEKIAAAEEKWVAQIISAIAECLGSDVQTVGLERPNAGAAVAFSKKGFAIVDAQSVLERARAIKSSEEIKCIVSSLRATERGVEQLKQALSPGMTENELWSVLHQAIIAQNGDYVETRLLSSGQRTNPWFQETINKVIGQNELVALDTDVVGCHGYYSDFSRTFHSGPDKPNVAQKELDKTAYEQVQHNVGILKAGMTFKEYSEKAWSIPEKYFDNRYYLSAHGCGMTGEYPYLYHRADYATAGYDGVILPGMVICVESYIGEAGGAEGVKLEEQVLIKENGIEILSQFAFEESML